jgi:hypothetical protein
LASIIRLTPTQVGLLFIFHIVYRNKRIQFSTYIKFVSVRKAL